MSNNNIRPYRSKFADTKILLLEQSAENMDGAAMSSAAEKLDVDKEREKSGDGGGRIEFQLYKRRWAVLALYVAYCLTGAFQWIQYAIIADVIVHYYNVSYLAVNWTSMIFMLAFVIMIFPATWFYNKVVSLIFVY